MRKIRIWLAAGLGLLCAGCVTTSKLGEIRKADGLEQEVKTLSTNKSRSGPQIIWQVVNRKLWRG